MFAGIKDFFGQLARLARAVGALADTAEELNTRARETLSLDAPLSLAQDSEPEHVGNGRKAKVAR